MVLVSADAAVTVSSLLSVALVAAAVAASAGAVESLVSVVLLAVTGVAA